MPFDPAQVMPQVSALADYYADRVMPGRQDSVAQAETLLRDAGQQALRQAAQAQVPRVLAFPWEEPAEPRALPAPLTAYHLLSSDGSDIDPDAHAQVPYAVIHVAVVHMAYEPPDYRVASHLSFRFKPEDLEITVAEDEQAVRVDRLVVDTLRAYEELARLWQGTQELLAHPDGRPIVAMMDGFLLWRHRGERQEAFGDRYLADSVHLLTAFAQAGVPLVSFDDTHHYEVVHTLMALDCPAPEQPSCLGCEALPASCRILRSLDDRDLFSFLPAGARSAIFQPIYRGQTSWRLPDTVRAEDPRLGFFYVNTGAQIARVELPLWLRDAGLLNQVHSIVVDQCQPRRSQPAGYPVVLAQAHREAAITPNDRQAIQWMIDEALVRRGVYTTVTAKAQMKKR